jgi:hypothetical protein
VRVTPFLMPNILYFTTPAADPAFGWLDALDWRVPVDDGHHVGFRVYLARVAGDVAERHRED